MTHARQVLERAIKRDSEPRRRARRSSGGAMPRRETPLNANKADPDSPKVLCQLSLVFARLGDDPSARRYLDLYQEKLRSVEERISALRTGGTLTPGASRR